MILSSTIKAQLTANFTSNTTSGCAPLFVQFNDASTGGPTQWQWDLGDGGTPSKQQNPATVYLVPGTYTVTLTVKDASTSNTITKTAYINVYAKPVVDFSVLGDTASCAPLNVQFADKSTPGSGTIQQETWDFGDGTLYTGLNAQHTYTLSDTFSVTLTVTNSVGCKQTAQKNNLVEIYPTANADFNYTYTNVCVPPATVNFKNTSTSQSPLVYQWAFGDGGTSTQTSPSHTFNTAGVNTITLVATTDQGCKDTVSKAISIGTVTASFDVSASVCANKPISFTNTSSPAPVSATWNFGDGKTGSGLNPVHTYTAPGTYSVRMNANFGGCSGSITKSVVVENKPAGSFTATGNTTTCNLPATVQFTNTTTGAVSYEWHFGDSTTSAEASPTHTYTKAGFYDVMLISFNSNGCSDTLIKQEAIKLGPPKVFGLQTLPDQGCAPLTINPRVNYRSAEPITSYMWSFGEGSVSTDSTPTFTYNNPGVYPVSVVVKTASGCVDSINLTDAVTVGSPTTVNFTATPTEGCSTKSIHFIDSSSGSITGWQWSFGDGTTSDLQNPSHNYVDTGYFDITLTISNNGCENTLTIPKYIHIKPPVADFDIALKCNANYARTFNNKSIGATSVLWDFGDGQTSAATNPAHTYAATGKYAVKLTATNGACQDVIIDTVNVIDQTPMFTFAPDQVCKYDSIAFTASNYDITSIAGFYWDYGDQQFTGFNVKNTSVTHKYTSSGTFNPFLVVRYTNNCKDTVHIQDSVVTIYGPTPSFSNVEGTCLFNNVSFTDESVPDSLHPITKWIWDYGDGSAPQEGATPAASHIYDSAKAYNVKLTVFDSYGCKDSVVVKNAVTITKPVADFTVLDSLRCTASAVNFIDSSKGLNLTYNWDFGDGDSSDEQSPLHIYPVQNTYSVKLSITDKFGCIDSIFKPNVVTISNPHAAFILNDSFGVCPPLVVNPINQSQNFESLLWDFQDGTSNQINPQHYYNTAGNFVLTLIAKGYGECYDTAYHNVVIKGPSGSFSFTPLSGCNPLKVNFKATTKDTESMLWIFDDGATEATKNSNFQYTYTTAGKYSPKLTLIDNAGCRVVISNPGDTVRVAQVYSDFEVGPSVGCDSSLVTFTDSSKTVADTIASYKWNFGDGGTSTDPNPTHAYNLTNSYPVTLVVTSINGCKDTITKEADIQVNPAPVAIINFPDSSCLATTVNFTGNDAANANTNSWLWSFGDGGSDTNQNTSYSYNTPGNFNVTLTASTALGCSDTATKLIDVLPPPNVDAGIDSFLCLGDAAQLTATGAATFTWAANPTLSCFNCATPLAMPTTSSTYYVTGNSAFGCVATDSVFIDVKQPIQNALNVTDTLCAGQSIQLQGPDGAELYSWQPSTGLDNPSVQNPVASPTQNTTYLLVRSDDKNCFSDSTQFTVQVFPMPQFNIIDSVITISLGGSDSIRTTSSPNVVAWSWNPASWLDCTNCAAPYTSPKGEITYTGQAYNEVGCSVSDQVTIRLLCNGVNVFVPNTFSPNNDGMNDMFFARGAGDFDIRSFRIFNRWGQEIFEKSNLKANVPASGWDGKYRGKDAPEGVYIYVMELVCDKNAVYTLKGNVTLLR